MVILYIWFFICFANKKYPKVNARRQFVYKTSVTCEWGVRRIIKRKIASFIYRFFIGFFLCVINIFSGHKGDVGKIG